LQVGDILDRGDHEVEIFYALERLQKEAKQAGGALHVLNGNHETMNIAQDVRYASAGGCQEFASWMETQHLACSLKKQCGCHPGWSEVPNRGAYGVSIERCFVVVSICVSALLAHSHTLTMECIGTLAVWMNQNPSQG
jgi:hypothetical protein